jgi:pSer/pThr/pTyr-binding forkhead associated (FHA) protein
VIVVDSPVLIGRNPQAKQVSSAGLPLLVVIESPYISGTHLLVNIEGDDVVATDVSRNGTYLTRQGGRPERMTKGHPTLLSDGCSLQLADEVSATVSVSKAV